MLLFIVTSENAIIVSVIAYEDISFINSSISFKDLTNNLTKKHPSPAIL